MTKIALTDDAIPMNHLILSLGKALITTRDHAIAMDQIRETTGQETTTESNLLANSFKSWFSACESLWYQNPEIRKGAEQAGLACNQITFEALLQSDRWPQDIRATKFEDIPLRFIFDPWRGVGGLVRVEDADLATAPAAVTAALSPIPSKAFLLPTQEDIALVAAGKPPVNLIEREFATTEELAAYKDGLEVLEDEFDEISSLTVNGAVVRFSRVANDDEDEDITLASPSAALAYAQALRDSEGLKAPQLVESDDPRHAVLAAFAAEQATAPQARKSAGMAL